jgi:hypothetical protein
VPRDAMSFTLPIWVSQGTADAVPGQARKSYGLSEGKGMRRVRDVSRFDGESGKHSTSPDPPLSINTPFGIV